MNDIRADRIERLRAERRRQQKSEDRWLMFVALIMTVWAMACVSLVMALAYWLVTR